MSEIAHSELEVLRSKISASDASTLRPTSPTSGFTANSDKEYANLDSQFPETVGGSTHNSFGQYNDHFTPETKSHAERPSPVPEHVAEPLPTYNNYDAKIEKERHPESTYLEPASSSTGKKRPKWLIILAIVLAIVVLLAIVLGAALGTTLHKKNDSKTPSSSTTSTPAGNPTTSSTPSSTSSAASASSTSPGETYIQAYSGTGLASVALVDGTYYLALYYQAPNSSIIELLFSDENLSSANFTPISQTVVLNGVLARSPLAALSYVSPDDDAVYIRQLIFFDFYGVLWQFNTTDGRTWDGSYIATTEYNALSTGSPALAACVNKTGDTYIFYSSDDIIYSVLGGLGEHVDKDVGIHQVWTDADTTAQVACDVYSGGFNFYMRNITTGRVTQWWDSGTTNGALLYTSGPSIANGTAMAATTDGVTYEYVYYVENGTQATLNGDTLGEVSSIWAAIGDGINGLDGDNLGVVGSASRMAASWYTTTSTAAAFLFYQNANTSEIQVLITDNENDHAINGTVRAMGGVSLGMDS